MYATRETVYREFSCARWNYWTYVEGLRYSINRKQYELMVTQGAKSVLVK